MITFFQPVWLLLLLPLAVMVWSWRLQTRFQRTLRILTLLLIILALARLALRLPDPAGVVVVVADRSASMPAQAATMQLEIIRLLEQSMGPRHRLGVVGFGEGAVVERLPERGRFTGFTAALGADQSALADGLEMALALLPADAGGRVLLLTDGKWTGRDPLPVAARAAARGVAVDYRLLTRAQAGDLAVQDFQAPQTVPPEQGYLLSAWIRSSLAQEVRYRLQRGSITLAAGSRTVEPGLTRWLFRDRAPETGVLEYTLTVEGNEPDPIPENNRARALVTVEGPQPLLVVSAAAEESGLADLLRRGGLRVTALHPEQVRWNLETLAGFDAVLLEQIPADGIGPVGLQTLARWVEDTGRGLMLTGGPKGFGPGGYFLSPLDRILPVSMETRREHLKLSVAVVVALDRSGSMAMPVGDGRVKMDLANLGTVQVLDLLGPADEIGVIAVDSSAHVIVPLNTVERNAAHRSRILSIQSMGGGIFVYEALTAAAQMIVESRSPRRHIILFADAADAEEPGQYVELLQKCREANITVSVIGLGSETDVDAWLLRDIARLGGGECYFTANAREIPRLFAQDVFTVVRKSFLETPTPFQFTSGQLQLGMPWAESPPPLGGYNLCYLREGAQQAAVTLDENSAPIVAFWNVGLGRVLAFCGEADGPFSGAFATWPQVGDFFTTLTRWTLGQSPTSQQDFLVTQELREGACVVQIHLDPRRVGEPFSALPRIRVLRAPGGLPPTSQTIPMSWKSADLLEAIIAMTSTETVLNTVEIPGQAPVTLPPICLPNSPELAPDQPGRGEEVLARIAAATGGRSRLEIPDIWRDLPAKVRYRVLSPWLFLAAMALFFLEIVERRTAWLSGLVQRPRQPEIADAEEGVPEVQTASDRPSFRAGLRRLIRTGTRFHARSHSTSTGAGAPASATVSPVPRPTSNKGEPARIDTLEALREARERARRRNL